MRPILLLAGVLLVIYGGAVLAGGSHRVAASRPLRERSKAYATVCLVAGAALVVAGVALG